MTKKTKCLKMMVAVLSVVLVMCLSVAGTLAYLQMMTKPVVNTFSPSNINLKLDETTGNTYKMVPGVVIPKDPMVTVTADIDCYVFVQVKESTNFDDYMTYAIANGWKLYNSDSTTIDTVANDTYILYREVTAAEAQNGKSFYVLAGDAQNLNGIVTIKNEVTKTQMDALYNTDGTVKTDSQPTLAFTAYAIQKEGFADAAAAWTQAQTQQ